MQRDRLVSALAAIFAAMTGVLVLVSFAMREPFVFLVALPLAAATYVFWYQASGKLRERVARSRSRRDRGRERGGFGTDPRGEWIPPGERGAGANERRRTRSRTDERRRDRRRTDGPAMDVEEAYRRLGLETGASEAAVKRAYREKVKEVHPDRGGDEETFMRLTEAYERLTD